jgi:uncharacterized protein (TIGR03382 family)
MPAPWMAPTIHWIESAGKMVDHADIHNLRASMNTPSRCAGLALAFLALTCGTAARATDLADGLQLSCDSTLTVLDGTDLSLRCAGNLSLQGVLNDVRLSRSGSISLEAGNDLSLSGLSLTATSVHLTATGRLQLASDVKIFSPDGTVVLDASSPGTGNPPAQVSGGQVTLRDPADSGGLPGNLIVQAGGDVSLGGSLGVTTAVPEPTTGLMGLMGAALVWRLARRRRSVGLGA